MQNNTGWMLVSLSCLHHKRAKSCKEGTPTYGRDTLRTPTTFGYIHLSFKCQKVLSNRVAQQMHVAECLFFFFKVFSCNNGRDGQLGCGCESGKDESLRTEVSPLVL